KYLRRARQHEVGHAGHHAEQFPGEEEQDDQSRRPGFLSKIAFGHDQTAPSAAAVRASTMKARSFWFNATKSGSNVIATVRGRLKLTWLSSRMRPGLALITQIRLPRNAA